MRHAKYLGFVLIMVGILVQWPTLGALVMFPIQVTMCVLLTRREERGAEADCGDGAVCSASTRPARSRT